MLTNRRVWAGLTVTLFFLALLLAQVDFGEMADALAGANYLYLVPAIAVYFVSLYFRSLRWKFLLTPFSRTVVARLYPVVVVGYMANNLLPIRMGELVRSYYLSLREPIRGSTGLATIIVERVFDGLSLLFLLAIGALFLPVSGLQERMSDAIDFAPWLIAMTVVAPFASVLALMVMAALKPSWFMQASGRLVIRLPARVQSIASGVAERFIGGFEGLHRPRRLVAVFLLSLPIWLVEGTMYYVVALGFGIQSEFDSVWVFGAAILVVVSVSNLATSIPSSQGSVGPFEFFGALSLVFLGVNSGVASAYVVVLHLALLLPVVFAGLLHLASKSLSLGDLAGMRKDQSKESLS